MINLTHDPYLPSRFITIQDIFILSLLSVNRCSFLFHLSFNDPQDLKEDKNSRTVNSEVYCKGERFFGRIHNLINFYLHFLFLWRNYNRWTSSLEGFFHVWKRGPRFTGFFLFHFPLPSVAQAFTGKKLKEEDRKSVS